MELICISEIELNLNIFTVSIVTYVYYFSAPKTYSIIMKQKMLENFT